MEYYSTLKMKEILASVTTRKNLEDMTLSEEAGQKRTNAGRSTHADTTAETFTETETSGGWRGHGGALLFHRWRCSEAG